MEGSGFYYVLLLTDAPGTRRAGTRCNMRPAGYDFRRQASAASLSWSVWVSLLPPPLDTDGKPTKMPASTHMYANGYYGISLKAQAFLPCIASLCTCSNVAVAIAVICHEA